MTVIPGHGIPLGTAGARRPKNCAPSRCPYYDGMTRHSMRRKDKEQRENREAEEFAVFSLGSYKEI